MHKEGWGWGCLAVQCSIVVFVSAAPIWNPVWKGVVCVCVCVWVGGGGGGVGVKTGSPIACRVRCAWLTGVYRAPAAARAPARRAGWEDEEGRPRMLKARGPHTCPHTRPHTRHARMQAGTTGAAGDVLLPGRSAPPALRPPPALDCKPTGTHCRHARRLPRRVGGQGGAAADAQGQGLAARAALPRAPRAPQPGARREPHGGYMLYSYMLYIMGYTVVSDCLRFGQRNYFLNRSVSAKTILKNPFLRRFFRFIQF